MNEQAGTTGAGMGEAAAGRDDETTMGVAEAAVIMQEASDRARRQLRVSHRATFNIWGLGLLLGYGTIWLTVRGQQPFHGIPPAAFAVGALLSTASIMTGVAQARADSGVGGLSAVRQRIHLLSVLAGLAAMFALEGALAHAGASRSVIGVFEASAPVLVAGLFYLISGVVRLDWLL